ncbi:MAG: hypothetical protein ACLRYY_14805 [Anaerobutyricum soehngenii]
MEFYLSVLTLHFHYEIILFNFCLLAPEGMNITVYNDSWRYHLISITTASAGRQYQN